MRISLYGGFGEKGRTCVGVQSGHFRTLLDAGVKTSARGSADYYPAISAAELADVSAIVITHAHEDHVAALGWCLDHGFAGRILMTRATRADCEDIIAAYGTAGHAALARAAQIDALPLGREAATLGPLRVTTGRSGHIAGGVWCMVDDGRTRFVYCGDVASTSPVFRMDPLPACDVLAIDASYADDDISFAARAAEIKAWIAAHPQGSIVPTPLFGRSLELFAILNRRVALAPGMREALQFQLDAAEWLVGDVAHELRQRLDGAPSWQMGEPLPDAPLLCHDGMGMSGPARALLHEAERRGHPVLLTGHVPEGSSADDLRAAGHADWIRLPTHPTLSENVAFVHACAPRLVLGHSCTPDALARLATHLPGLRYDLATGDHVDVA
jgi:glyoxylase-like metal-dependent hydrolase (beta-lactamase superfamily II)